jgi:hypothetical protein
MKKQISILGLIFLSIITQAQQTCGEQVISNFHSMSWSSYQPDIELNASFRFKDSIQFVGTPTLIYSEKNIGIIRKEFPEYN